MPEERSNVWPRTVALLDSTLTQQAVSEAARIVQKRVAKPNWTHHATLLIRVIDRSSPQTITVSWRDPLSGYYEDQVWVASSAQRSGQCVLTGGVIKRGDVIYRPRGRRPRPGNADAMIIGSCVDAALNS